RRGSAPPGGRGAMEGLRGSAWRGVRTVRVDARGRFRARYVPRPASRRLRLRARVLADGQPGATSRSIVVRTRDVVLAAVGDVNLGDGPASERAAPGPRRPALRAA